jgi:hypothetical protein
MRVFVDGQWFNSTICLWINKMKDAIINTLIDLTFEQHVGFGHLGQQILNRPKIVNALIIEILLHMFCLGAILFTFSFQHLNNFFHKT